MNRLSEGNRSWHRINGKNTRMRILKLVSRTHMKSLYAFFFFWWENTENASTKFKRGEKSPRLAFPRTWYFGPAEQLHWLCDDI